MGKPSVAAGSHTFRHWIQGVALDGRVRGEEADLASSTLLADENSRDIFGMVISYTAKVKLFLGAIGGELSAELPFILMHPKPNMKKILKADTMGHSTGSTGGRNLRRQQWVRSYSTGHGKHEHETQHAQGQKCLNLLFFSGSIG